MGNRTSKKKMNERHVDVHEAEDVRERARGYTMQNTYVTLENWSNQPKPSRETFNMGQQACERARAATTNPYQNTGNFSLNTNIPKSNPNTTMTNSQFFRHPLSENSTPKSNDGWCLNSDQSGPKSAPVYPVQQQQGFQVYQRGYFNFNSPPYQGIHNEPSIQKNNRELSSFDEREIVTAKLNIQVDCIENKINKFEITLSEIDNKIKQQIKNLKKEEAFWLVRQKKNISEKITSFRYKKHMLQEHQISLENTKHDEAFTIIVADSNKLIQRLSEEIDLEAIVQSKALQEERKMDRHELDKLMDNTYPGDEDLRREIDLIEQSIFKRSQALFSVGPQEPRHLQDTTINKKNENHDIKDHNSTNNTQNMIKKHEPKIEDNTKDQANAQHHFTLSNLLLDLKS